MSDEQEHFVTNNPLDTLEATAFYSKPTALLSMICSYVVIREVIVDLRSSSSSNASIRNQKRDNNNIVSRPLRRTLLSLSIADLFFSLPWFLGTWMVPEGTPWAWGAMGNQATCNFQGFITQIGMVASPLFNLMLVIFSLLMVRYGWNNHRLAKLEPWFHSFVWPLALVSAIFPIPLQLYNPFPHSCWFTGYPLGCKDSLRYGDDEADCIRGDGAWAAYITYTVFPAWPCIFASTVMMVLMYRSVRHIEDRIAKYAGSMRTTASRTKQPTLDSQNHTTTSGDTTSTNDWGTVAAEPEKSVELQNVVNREKSRVVGIQGMLYVVSFLLVYFLDVITSIMLFAKGPEYSHSQPVLLFFAYGLLYPSQGIWTFIIFCRPRPEMKTPEGRFLRHVVCCSFGCCNTITKRETKDDMTTRPQPFNSSS